MRKVSKDGFSSEFQKRHKRNKKAPSLGKLSFSVLLLRAFLVFNILGLIAAAWFSIFLPSVNDLENLMGKESTVFYDVEGKVIYTVNSEEHRENVSIDTLPQHILDSTVAIEDDKFYKHNGFDLGGLVKAVLSEFGIGTPRGGSTITQQFIKNSLLSRERTYTRKFKELVLASRLERSAEKREILEMYLNRIPYGGQAYGVQKAAEVFFDKNSDELTLVESAVLAALPNAPTYFSPFGDNKFSVLTKEFTLEDLEENDIQDVSDLTSSEWRYGLLGREYELSNGRKIYLPGRANNVLRRMHELEYLDDAELETAKAELEVLEFNKNKSQQKAYHFVTYVKSLLEQEFGKDMVENAGLKVYTTIDLEFQQKVEAIVKKQAETNESYKVNNAAVISIEPITGHVKAMVGSKDFADEEIEGFNNMVLAKRQPGSSFKPIVFASAFERGLAPGHTIFDIPIKIGEDEPQNYDGEFMGPISVRKALGQSRNIPAVKAYFVAGEQDSIISFTEKIGIKSLDRRSDYGWPLSLGTGEMSLLELAQGYSVFANQGKLREINPILKVLDDKGEVLMDNRFIIDESQLQESVAPEITYLINNILSDQSVNLGPRLTLPGKQVAAKTGTSTKRIEDIIYPTNLYTLGWTKDLVTVAWAGNTDGSETSLSASGYSQAGPIWQETMLEYHKELEKNPFNQPKDVKNFQFSRYSGMVPSDLTPSHLLASDLFIEEFKPSKADDIYFEAEVDVRNLKLTNKYCPREYVKFIKFLDNLKMETFSETVLATYRPHLLADRQNEIREWFLSLSEEEVKALNLGSKVAIGSPVLEESELCSKKLASMELSVQAKDLENGYFIDRGNSEIEVDIVAEAGIERVEYYVNDFLKYKNSNSPYSGLIRISSSNNTPVQLKIKVFDKNDYVAESNYNLIVGKSSKNPEKDSQEGDEEEGADSLGENQETEGSSSSSDPQFSTDEIILNPDGLANQLDFDPSKINSQ